VSRRNCLLLLGVVLSTLALSGCNGWRPPSDDAGTDDDGLNDDNNDQGTSGALVISGRLNPGQTTKTRPRLQGQTYPFTIVAQSDQTGRVYRVETDSNGEFNLPLPDEEAGNSFVVTILGPDGRAVGPVIMGADGGAGVTGLAMKRDADLGTIILPDDPATEPIVPGDDSDVEGLADSNLAARVNQNGAPIGLASVGKGQDTVADEGRPAGKVDADRDGLIDLLDADDDGNGVVDDFDKGDEWTGATSDIHVNFFMNLKIQAEDAQTYYRGTEEQISEALAQQTVITFEVFSEAGATRAITTAHLLETPGPAYLTVATVRGASEQLWKAIDYALTASGDRFEAFVVPQAVMDAGDTFTLEVAFDDGTTTQVSRMINYVFKNIPTLVEYGPPGDTQPFDITDPRANGSPSAPLRIDGDQDLVLVFRPPPDETGAPITGMDYTFHFFFYDADGQPVSDIDTAATWPTSVFEPNSTTVRVAADELGALSDDGTHTFTLDQQCFADRLVLKEASEVEVGAYKVDITAEAPTGNAAIMLYFVKQ